MSSQVFIIIRLIAFQSGCECVWRPAATLKKMIAFDLFPTGITVGMMLVPQGIAYAGNIAELPAQVRFNIGSIL